MAQFLQNTGQDHHENWTSNQLPVPFPTVHDTLCLLHMVHEQEARSKGMNIMRRDMEVQEDSNSDDLLLPSYKLNSGGEMVVH